MPCLEVPDILLDPDFAEEATLIRRVSTVNEFGEHITNEVPQQVLLVVQKVLPETLAKLPDSARLSQLITVYYRGEIQVEGPGTYADIVVVNGDRYQAISIEDGFANLPGGFTAATCALEAVSE